MIALEECIIFSVSQVMRANVIVIRLLGSPPTSGSSFDFSAVKLADRNIREINSVEIPAASAKLANVVQVARG